MIWQQLEKDLASLLAGQGFNIVHAFPVQLFNSQGCPEQHQLPDFGRSSTLGLVIGNTNRLWPAFVQHLAAQPHLHVDNPLDDFVQSVVRQAVWRCCQDTFAARQHQQHSRQPGPVTVWQQQQQQQQQQPDPCSQHNHQSKQPIESNPTNSLKFAIRFSHHTEPGQFVNMMRAAQLSGLAYYSNTTHLCMHPVYGPWFALRAVAVIDVDGPDPAGFSQLPCPHPDLEAEAAEQMEKLEALGGFSSWQQHWRDWAALRSLGGRYTDSKYAYSADQLEYHYTKNQEVLKRAAAALQQQHQQQP